MVHRAYFPVDFVYFPGKTLMSAFFSRCLTNELLVQSSFLPFFVGLLLLLLFDFSFVRSTVLTLLVVSPFGPVGSVFSVRKDFF